MDKESTERYFRKKRFEYRLQMMAGNHRDRSRNPKNNESCTSRSNDSSLKTICEDSFMKT